MGMPKYGKKRDDNEPEIIKALQDAGVTVQQLDRPVDLATKYGDRIRFIEVKNAEGFNREEKGQKEFLDVWPGGFARTKDEALEIAIGNEGV